MRAQLLSHIWLSVNPCIVAHLAILSMGFSRKEYRSQWPFPSPGDFPNPGVKPKSRVFPASAGKADSLPAKPLGKAHYYIMSCPLFHLNFTAISEAGKGGVTPITQIKKLRVRQVRWVGQDLKAKLMWGNWDLNPLVWFYITSHVELHSAKHLHFCLPAPSSILRKGTLPLSSTLHTGIQLASVLQSCWQSSPHSTSSIFYKWLMNKIVIVS